MVSIIVGPYSNFGQNDPQHLIMEDNLNEIETPLTQTTSFASVCVLCVKFDPGFWKLIEVLYLAGIANSNFAYWRPALEQRRRHTSINSSKPRNSLFDNNVAP